MTRRADLEFFAEKWRWFLKDGDKWHAAFLSEIQALADKPICLACELAPNLTGNSICKAHAPASRAPGEAPG